MIEPGTPGQRHKPKLSLRGGGCSFLVFIVGWPARSTRGGASGQRKFRGTAKMLLTSAVVFKKENGWDLAPFRTSVFVLRGALWTLHVSKTFRQFVIWQSVT
jgi:hypothetical protein